MRAATRRGSATRLARAVAGHGCKGRWLLTCSLSARWPAIFLLRLPGGCRLAVPAVLGLETSASAKVCCFSVSTPSKGRHAPDHASRFPKSSRRVQQGPVVYVACEGAHGFKARITAYRQRHLSGIETPPFYLVPTRLDLIDDHEELIREIRGTLGATRPAAIVLDTLNRSLRGSENNDEDMSDYIKASDALREAFGCAVIIVHHCGTEGTRPRGHTSLTGAADAQLAVNRNTSGLVTVTVEWMKDGPEGDQINSRLEAVEVGTDDDGDPITSCVVVPVEAQSQAPNKPLTGHTKTAYDALIAVIDQRQTPSESDDSEHVPMNVPVDVWREEFYARQIDGRDMKRDTLKKRFQRAAETLQAVGKAGFRDGEAWINRKAGHSGT